MTRAKVNQFLSILFFLILNVACWAQELQKKDLIKDIIFLRGAAMNERVGTFTPKSEMSLDSLIQELEISTKDKLTPLEYSLGIERAIFRIGCIHTQVSKNPLIQNELRSFIPLTVKQEGKNLVITSAEDTTKIGDLIFKINDLSADQILRCYKEYKASDGGTNAFSQEYFRKFSSYLIATALKNPDKYKVQTSKEAFELLPSDKIYQMHQKSQTGNRILINNDNFLKIFENYAILKITSFSKSDKRFFASCFEKLEELHVPNLIIDIRQNTGGNRRSAVELAKYTVDSSFSYSILQGKTQISRYLTARGKIYLAFSKIKYNIFGIFRKKKNSIGTEYIYGYHPKKRNHNRGKIYVLTDGFTASSSTMLTSWLKQYSSATFIGTQAGGGFNGNNGGSFPIIKLPHSGIEIVFPAYRIVLDKTSQDFEGIVPEIITDTDTDHQQIIKIIETRNENI